MKKNFKAGDVVSLYQQLKSHDIPIWLDGGWGVDALLGKQTRPHDDLDIVTERKYIKNLRELLSARGYIDIPRDDTSEWNFVMEDNEGRQVDIHVIVLDESGNGIYGPIERKVFYPAESLSGIGQINGATVRCLTPEYQVESHTGYEINEKDMQDVTALCEKFKIVNPHRN